MAGIWRWKQHTVLLAALLAAGCGFHLPTQDYSTLLEGGVAIAGGENTAEFLPELQAALRRAGAGENEATWRVEVLRYRETQSILRVDLRGRAAEYFLESTVDFRIGNGTAAEPLTQKLYVSRHMRHNLQGLSDAGAAESFYREEMRQVLAQRLVERLAEYARTAAER